MGNLAKAKATWGLAVLVVIVLVLGGGKLLADQFAPRSAATTQSEVERRWRDIREMGVHVVQKCEKRTACRGFPDSGPPPVECAEEFFVDVLAKAVQAVELCGVEGVAQSTANAPAQQICAFGGYMGCFAGARCGGAGAIACDHYGEVVESEG